MKKVLKFPELNAKVIIKQDDCPSSPREENDQLGKMVCFHGRYTLGDKHKYYSDEYNGWSEMKQAIKKNEKASAILPLYLYDHSGITMNTTGFSCSWDSGLDLYYKKISYRKLGCKELYQKSTRKSNSLFDCRS